MKVTLFQERDNLILRSHSRCIPPQFTTTGEKYPQPFVHKPNSLLYQDHLYTQIPSLTSGYDHQYESLPALYQLGYHHMIRHTMYAEIEEERNIFFRKSVEELVSNRDQGLNNYKKYLCLPILDDINSIDYAEETEIKIY
jgi:hypothetical protein